LELAFCSIAFIAASVLRILDNSFLDCLWSPVEVGSGHHLEDWIVRNCGSWFPLDPAKRFIEGGVEIESDQLMLVKERGCGCITPGVEFKEFEALEVWVTGQGQLGF